MNWRVEEQHTLGTAAAAQRLHSFVSNLRAEYGSMVATSSENWSGNTLAYSIRGKRGREVAGEVVVTDRSVLVTASCDRVPAFLSGTIESRIRSALRKALRS